GQSTYNQRAGDHQQPSLLRRCGSWRRLTLGVRGSSRQGCASNGVQVPIPSITRLRRLAYPGHGEVINRERLGRRNHGCPTAETVAVGATWVVSKPAGLNRKK